MKKWILEQKLLIRKIFLTLYLILETKPVKIGYSQFGNKKPHLKPLANTGECKKVSYEF